MLVLKSTALQGCPPDQVTGSDVRTSPARPRVVVCQQVRHRNIDGSSKRRFHGYLSLAINLALRKGMSRSPIDAAGLLQAVDGVLAFICWHSMQLQAAMQAVWQYYCFHVDRKSVV